MIPVQMYLLLVYLFRVTVMHIPACITAYLTWFLFCFYGLNLIQFSDRIHFK